MQAADEVTRMRRREFIAVLRWLEADWAREPMTVAGKSGARLKGGLAYGHNVPVIRATATTVDAKLRQVRAQAPVLLAQLSRVADVELS